MSGVLSSFFSRDPRATFAFEIPSTPERTIEGRVHMAASHKKADPTETATVFWAPVAEISGGSLRQQAQKLKTMRHPNVLTFLDSLEADGTFYLITEPCKPLENYLSDVELSDEQKENVLAWGFFQTLCALRFLHDDARQSHEAIRRAIFVTPSGDFKLSALQHATTFDTPRTDLNQLGLVLWECWNGFDLCREKPEAPRQMAKKFHDLYKKCATPAAARTTASQLIDENRKSGGVFKSRFVDTLLFLEEFQLKSAAEKQVFFTSLHESLDIFPDDVAKHKILPKLIHAYEYGDAGPNILIPLFKLGRLLSADDYQRKIVPCLCKLFSSPDRVTRVKLLERIDEFAPNLTPSVVNDKIYGPLAAGFLDTSPAVRESTVKAMVALAEKLNANNLNVDLMKHLARLQGTDEHGGIRTNTTICLGKIGHLLDPAHRQRILLGAFTRATKDPFPPARLGALLAFSATQQFYALSEIAHRLLPAIVPLLVDPEKQVRDQAFKASRGFIDKLEKASENPDLVAELEASVKAGGKSAVAEKVPQWASWALKSLSGKFYKGTPPAVAQNTDQKPAETLAAENAVTTSSSRPSSAMSTPAQKPIQVAKKPTTTSGWDDDFEDAEENVEDFGSMKISETPAKKAIGTAIAAAEDGDDDADWGNTSWTKPASKSSTAPKSKTSASDGWDEPADGGWDEPQERQPKPAASSLDARRAEAAARAEQRRKEIAEKRTQKGGALKLSAKTTAAAQQQRKQEEPDFSSW